jgi:hypothetical protein
VLTARDVVRQSAASTPLAGSLSSLPALPKLPALSSLPASGLTSTLASATKPVQAHLLSAEVTPASAAPGMGSSSLLALAAGAVLAGAATFVAAGRRLGIRRSGR